MQDTNKPYALQDGLYYKLLIAGAIALTCVFILGIRYFLKPQDTASGTAADRNNVFNSNPGPLAPGLPQTATQDGEPGAGH